MNQPEVALDLERHEAALRHGLLPWIRTAQDRWSARMDQSTGGVTDRVMLLLNGFLDRIATVPGFIAKQGTTILRDTVRRPLRPR